MNKKYASIFGLTAFLLVAAPTTIVQAEDSSMGWDYNCTDSDYLFKNATIFTPTSEIEINQTILCEHGCGSDLYGNSRCRDSSFMRYIYIIVALALITVVGIFIVGKTR